MKDVYCVLYSILIEEILKGKFILSIKTLTPDETINELREVVSIEYRNLPKEKKELLRLIKLIDTTDIIKFVDNAFGKLNLAHSRIKDIETYIRDGQFDLYTLTYLTSDMREIYLRKAKEESKEKGEPVPPKFAYFTSLYTAYDIKNNITKEIIGNVYYQYTLFTCFKTYRKMEKLNKIHIRTTMIFKPFVLTFNDFFYLVYNIYKAIDDFFMETTLVEKIRRRGITTVLRYTLYELEHSFEVKHAYVLTGKNAEKSFILIFDVETPLALPHIIKKKKVEVKSEEEQEE